MSQDNQIGQQVPPTGPLGPGAPTPHPSSPLGATPDSQRLPQAGVPDSGHQGRDWQASFQGLQHRYQQDVVATKQAMETQGQRLDTLTGQVSQLIDLLSGQSPAGGAPAEAPPVTPQGSAKPEAPPAKPVSTGNDQAAVIKAAQLAEAKAVKYQLLAEYTQPGKPGAGLPLLNVAEQIMTVEPTVGAEGQLDFSGQRAVIESFIDTVKQAAGPAQQDAAAQAAQQMAAGMLPGASPGGAPPTDPVQAKYERYEYLKGFVGSDEFMALDNGEQQRLNTEFLTLLNEVGQHMDSAVTIPFLSNNMMMDRWRQFQSQMAGANGGFL